MSETSLKLHRIAVVSHPKLNEAVKEAVEISRYLLANGFEVCSGMLGDENINQAVNNGEIDLLIALGGDGTMLRAGHICAPAQIPILGINLGHFGFLIEIRQHQWQQSLERLFNNDYWIERRMMLCAELFRSDVSINKWDVLNEVVVGRGQIVRPVHLVTEVDGRLLTTYVADALIAATPTGSTAYALAAGGPILPPELRTILLVAVAPHLSIDRAIVLAEGSSVSITVQMDHEAVVCIDGQTPIALVDGDRIHVRSNEYTTQFVRFQDPGYFYRNLTPHMNQNPSTGNSR